ncbi:uncharacterized protein IL334_003236 [Kwoniella shivajii]|uniref:RRM domain-containing protein n=1 Tax=Kwoniella shivajii TaxID=564305 RepID=A0ABZ1CXJ3_9TREE|nr:hypothetical protein IL334_003236 [Kwoniella shivajii]
MTYSYPRRSPSPLYEPYPPILDPRYPSERERERERDYPPRRSAPQNNASTAEPNNVLGVFGLSIRTRERDLEDEFMRYGDVEKVVIVYDQRTDRSRGFGFITMRTIEDATRAIEKLNGLDLHGRNIRVDYSATQKPHAPTPGQYMGVKRPATDDRYDRRGGGGGYPPPRGYDNRYERRDYGGGGGYDNRRGGGHGGYDNRGGHDSRGGYDNRAPRHGHDDRERYRDRDEHAPRRDYDEYSSRPKREEYDSRRRSPSPRRPRYSASPDRGSRAPRDYESASGAAPAPEATRY